MTIKVGDVFSAERTFTTEDVAAFTRLSGDHGRHHLQPDAQGRLVAHGLLTATLPTTIGGRLNFLAREMVFDFRRPVYSGDTIRCVGTVTRADHEPGRLRAAMEFECKNQNGEVVLRGSTHGVILLGENVLDSA